jgi:SAM-dependent methyltransferase
MMSPEQANTRVAGVTKEGGNNHALDAYIVHLERHREMWEAKPAVRRLYLRWYGKMTSWLSPMNPTVELGCGCGNFKEFYPDVIATDALATPWCDQVVDACEMPFEDCSVGNLVQFDVLHHIPVAMRFFEEALRVLRPGGRLILIEPFITLFSRLVYGTCHHEPFDLQADLLNAERPSEQSVDYANEAAATIILHRRFNEFAERLPDLTLIRREPFAGLSYPLTGGFQKLCLIPAWAVSAMSSIEDFLIGRLGMSFLAMRLLVVLEKAKFSTSDATPGNTGSRNGRIK